ncbi:MAG: YbjN domain-containing protein [Bacteroidales bacterium]|jgi:hypothetical protein|nr:YbjN domain-containing protein [Bacteroidales bacterium]
MKTSEMVLNYLKEQGLCPQVDDDGDIIFKYQMLTFIYFENDEDEKFFRLALPGIYDVTEDNRISVLEAANEVNKRLKVAKVFIPNNDVWVSAETLMDDTPELDDFVPRILNILLGSRQTFYEIVNE